MHEKRDYSKIKECETGQNEYGRKGDGSSMEMVIVEVSVPAVNEKFDFKLPSTVKIKDVTSELVRMIQVTKGNVMFDPDMTLLCDLENGKVFNPNLTVAEQQITDGSSLQLL